MQHLTSLQPHRRTFLGTMMTIPLAIGTGCAASPHHSSAAHMAPGTGLAFGAFDFRDSDINATHVVLMRISPTQMYVGSSGERGTITFTRGEFYAPNLSPGMYVVQGFFSGNVYVSLKDKALNKSFVVVAGRAVYAGSFRVLHAQNQGLKRTFSLGEGSFERVDSRADEDRLLTWLAEELGPSPWANAVRIRKAALAR
jgi:hypothetical protein